MRIENKYNDVYYTTCDDVGENTGGYFIQFYSDPDFVDEIDNMVLRKETEEVNNPEKYIHEYIVNEKLELLVARKALENGIKDNPKILEVVDMFMNDRDNEALEQLYAITKDKLLEILITWKEEYGDIIDNPQTNISYMYSDIIGYVWDKYGLNEMTQRINGTKMKKKELEEKIVSTFENQLNTNRNKFELNKDIELANYSMTELNYLVSKNILKVSNISNLKFRLEQKYIDRFLEKKWENLTDIPFIEKDSEEILDGTYWDFTKGLTTKEDIWHYFDHNHSKGVHFLLYELDNSPIESTQELVDIIKNMEKIDILKIKTSAESLDLANTFFTFELKRAILDKLEVIEMNHLQEKMSFEEIKTDIIDTISEISELYGVKIEDTEEDEVRE